MKEIYNYFTDNYKLAYESVMFNHYCLNFSLSREECNSSFFTAL